MGDQNFNILAKPLLLATVGRRLIASIIDEIILVIIIYLIDININISVIGNSILMTIIYSSYFVFFHYKQGKTLGKRIVSIKVVDSNNTSKNLSLLNSLKRDCIPCLLSMLCLFYFILNDYKSINDYDYFAGLINLIWIILELTSMLFNKKKQSIHDLIGNTVVIIE